MPQDNKNDLEFNEEFVLNIGPLSIDLLIIKKNNDAVIKSGLGALFKKENIWEYKSPGDKLNYKTFNKDYASKILDFVFEINKNNIEEDDKMGVFTELYNAEKQIRLKDEELASTKKELETQKEEVSNLKKRIEQLEKKLSSVAML